MKPIEMLKVNQKQLERNPVLSLGFDKKHIVKCKKITDRFGCVKPVTVAKFNNLYRILDGQCWAEAYEEAEIRDVPILVADADSDIDQKTLSLVLALSSSEKKGILQGELINSLACDGVPIEELTKQIGKSKSWFSKRRSLAERLDDEVKQLVKSGTIYASTAEEIVKLPKEVQMRFASNVVSYDMSKAKVADLVKLYCDKNTVDACRKAIVESPLTVPAFKTNAASSRRKDPRSVSVQIGEAARLAVELIDNMAVLYKEATNEDMKYLKRHMSELNRAVKSTRAMLGEEAEA